MKKKAAMKKKAVAIAKDVLERLEKRKLYPTKGTYLYYSTEYLISKENCNEDAQKNINEIEKNCLVCALGACFLSYIRLYDGKTYSEVLLSNRPSMKEDLEKAFTNEELDLIEECYECWDDWTTSDSVKDWIEKNHNKTNNQRLKLIMENIVKNKGALVL